MSILRVANATVDDKANHPWLSWGEANSMVATNRARTQLL
jgi:hypothetical protein